MTTLLTATVVGGALLTTAVPAAAQTDPVMPRERLVAEVLPAVTYVETRATGWVREKGTGREIGTVRLTGTCSGVVVANDGHVATAGHCVDAADLTDSLRTRLAGDVATTPGATGTPAQYEAFILGRYDIGGPTAGSPIERRVSVVRADASGPEKRLDATIVDSLPNERGDVALLDVDGENLPAAPLAPAGDPTPGTPVTAVGYPADRDRLMDPSRDPSWKDGTVSSVQTRDGVPFVEVSADMAPGMSGGPAVDARGRVIGLNSMGIGDSGAFNFLAPTSALRSMLERNGVVTEPGPVDTRYRAGLDALAAGENADAIAALTEVTRLRPDHTQAAKQLTTAQQAYAAVGDASENRTRTLVIVAASVTAFLVLVGGALTAVLLVRRSRRRHPAFPTTGPIAFPAGHPSGPFPTAGGPAGHPSGPIPAPFATPPWGTAPAPGPHPEEPAPTVERTPEDH
ncbi:S1 family peptidase [Actinomycetospora termitidis]|uniref:Serine protease n=1 Tax=Actinomycetospora termitidis TaxID=3053470 RepID=A0ABT7M801_9PSEU|nr:serine protease [Actinomycetospora sp. Odt1-22]MDL5156805.1 serine protease [Actinomycetospora sp. Odt1-22]